MMTLILCAALLLIGPALFWVCVAVNWMLLMAIGNLLGRLFSTEPEGPHCHIDPRCHPAYARVNGEGYIGGVRVPC